MNLSHKLHKSCKTHNLIKSWSKDVERRSKEKDLKEEARRWFLSSQVLISELSLALTLEFSFSPVFRVLGAGWVFVCFSWGFRISKSYGAGAGAAAAAAGGIWKECGGGGAARDQFEGASTRGFGGVEQHSVPDLRRLQQVSGHSHRSGFRHSSSCMENASSVYHKFLFYWCGCCGGQLRSSLGRRFHHYRSTTFPSSLSPPTHPPNSSHWRTKLTADFLAPLSP